MFMADIETMIWLFFSAPLFLVLLLAAG
jgi:hypothetical protein